jgi:pimeloyl-ACP methyl ester carboxylesterase
MTNSDNAQAPEQPPTPRPEIRPMEPNERIIQANGVDLCVQTFGNRADPPILLIMGGASSMEWWEDGFCERLMANSRFVIRYDHRDTADRSATSLVLRSTRCLIWSRMRQAFSPPSDWPAHISWGSRWAGGDRSTGGARPSRSGRITHPDLNKSSRSWPRGSRPSGKSEETRALFSKAGRPDPSDRAAVIDYLVYLARASSSRSRPFREAAFRDLAGRVFDRTGNIASRMTNHNTMGGGCRWRERLRDLNVPALVIHCTGDELPRRVWDAVVPAILEHTSRG